MDKLTKAFQILGELMNKECFDFWEVKNSTYDERKEYLRDMIFEYFRSGEVDLAGIIKRVDSSDYLYEGLGVTPETIDNINDFFKDEELVADVILFMDEDIYNIYKNENNN